METLKTDNKANKKPNLEFVEKLKQIKTILTNEQSKMENSLTSVECITKNMEETTDILINTKNEILKCGFSKQKVTYLFNLANFFEKNKNIFFSLISRK